MPTLLLSASTLWAGTWPFLLVFLGLCGTWVAVMYLAMRVANRLAPWEAFRLEAQRADAEHAAAHEKLYGVHTRPTLRP